MPSAVYAALCSSKLLNSELRGLSDIAEEEPMSSSVVERLRMLGNSNNGRNFFRLCSFPLRAYTLVRLDSRVKA